MEIDINELVAKMLDSIKASVKDNWKNVKDYANEFLQKRKDRLELLISLRAHNEISQEFFMKRLKDEENVLKAELHSIAIINKATAQKAANNALKILEAAVKTIASNVKL